AGSPIHYSKKEISFTKKAFILDIKANEECLVEEVDFKVYKPIEIWKCNSIEEAIEMCEKNSDKDCWVYLEITTDRYLREDEIKMMKTAKKDILEISPLIKGENTEEIDLNSFSDKSFEETFRDFYFKERQLEPQQELIDLLLGILGEEEDYETN
ncbi:MAG: exonuclease SbcCD subunit D, partial [Tissierellia bacterium]|nr:exonuclease SbcCD subunit D [Tissierellia bacterium]